MILNDVKSIEYIGKMHFDKIWAGEILPVMLELIPGVYNIYSINNKWLTISHENNEIFDKTNVKTI